MKKTFHCTILFIILLLIMGCSGLSQSGSAPDHAGQAALLLKPAADKVVVYVYRVASFKGGGRTHILQLDGRDLGRLTSTNYYRLELWPGKYHINIHLPPETFLGVTSPPMNAGYGLNLPARDVGQSFILVYADGEKIKRHAAEKQMLKAMLNERSLGTALDFEQTAHVTRFYDTKYEGPEMHGEPHGRGILYWEDGSRYEGVFHYGQLTREGRFYFPDGSYYMGRLEKGRPMGSGVLFSPKGKVLYAGPFKEEKPDGTGIRMGEKGPVYCSFEQGEDVTPSFFDLADAAVDEDDRMEKNLFQAYWPSPEMTDADEIYLELYRTEYQAFLDELEETREMRKSEAHSKLVEEQMARISLERQWCEEKFNKGDKWCICAPFDAQVKNWEACVW